MHNATLTGWEKCGGTNVYGQPVRTAQAGRWNAVITPVSKNLERNGRSVRATLQAVLRGSDLPAIDVGDFVAVAASTWEVLSADRFEHPTLGHLTLLLG